MINRRQRQQYIFAGLLGAFALINILFFLILYRPTRNEYFRLQSSIATLQSETHTREGAVARLERVSAQLGSSETDRRELQSRHFVQRDAGFAEIMPLLESMAQRSGVRNNRKDYAIEPIPQYGLHSVNIRFEVQGNYSNVMRFIEELENSQTLFITNAIDVQGADGGQGASGSVIVNFALETFFYE